MLQTIILEKKNAWLQSPDCTVKSLVDYIRTKGEMRETQIEAIETYLFLKIAGENKPLWQLFAEGLFNPEVDLSKLNVNETARACFVTNTAARSLYLFASRKENGKSLLPEVEQYILDSPETIEYEKIIKEIFYDVSYSDYLFSLPMGAGKTYLMAAFIYLDLYFAINEPRNKNFAHNFIVLVPSGLKSSIVPSLKTIEKFNPSWVLDEPAASEIKRLLKFEVLDQPKTAKQSNKARNPNAQKINHHLAAPNLKGLVLVVNAEKVILDRIDVVKVGETISIDFHENATDEQDKQANELRNLIGKIPNLQILIDEVHHAATDDIKLRQVVNRWNAKGSITTVLGFSGTPYLDAPDKIGLNEKTVIKFPQITNTVYYFPLLSAIQQFLKKPTIRIAEKLGALNIIERGVENFYKDYKETTYANGCIAKMAIYCGNIERLEEEVFPFVTELIKKHGDSEANILKFHRGNKRYKISKENEREYNSLDLALSKKRIILLVQIGKEGWDCKSLGGVILSQQGDCPRNMVLQTSCRCLRQVVKGNKETALIWLNDENAKALNAQLKEEQNTSIQEINNIGAGHSADLVDRFPRIDYLQLPPVDFYQMRIDYTTTMIEDSPNSDKKLMKLTETLDTLKRSSVIKTVTNLTQVTEREVVGAYGTRIINYSHFLLDIVKGSFGTLTIPVVEEQSKYVEQIFSVITFDKNGSLLLNDQYDYDRILTEIRLAFWIKRNVETKEDVVKQNAELLLIDKLHAVQKNDKLYPNGEDVKDILNADATGKTIEEIEKELEAFNTQLKELVAKQGMIIPYQPKTISYAVKSKDKTFHYLPYDFSQSGLEKDVLEKILTLQEFKQRQLEIYYNGERGLTNFVIHCYGKKGTSWKSVGKYTPDFLVVQRKKKALHKIMILETKGEGFRHDPKFVEKKNYVSSEFLRLNETKFGYRRFEYLYIPENEPQEKITQLLNDSIVQFFND